MHKRPNMTNMGLDQISKLKWLVINNNSDMRKWQKVWHLYWGYVYSTWLGEHTETSDAEFLQYWTTEKAHNHKTNTYCSWYCIYCEIICALAGYIFELILKTGSTINLYISDIYNIHVPIMGSNRFNKRRESSKKSKH